MQQITRFILIYFFAVVMTNLVQAKTETATSTPATPVEYKRADSNFYLKADILKNYPKAVILAEGVAKQNGDSYLITPKKKAAKEVYLEVRNDWIEPITPPDMPASLGVAPDAMQVREPQGDVQVALPSAPANFAPVTDGMTLPNGAVLKTGANGTAAVLFGGVASARLIPNSTAAVQQTVTAKSRSTEIDLRAGAVFSKVGKQVDVTEDYEVQTPFGSAAARGTDFVTVVLPDRTDVWIAQGTVQLNQPGGQKVGTVTSDGSGLKIIRFPLITNHLKALAANVETFTTAFNFIPLANQKIKALRDKANGGTALSQTEKDYLSRIKQLVCLIKLELVEPPAPTPPPTEPVPAPTSSASPAAPAAPMEASPAPSAATTAAPAEATPASAVAPATTPEPLKVVVHTNGKIRLKGVTYTLPDFQAKLSEIIQANPGQPIEIYASKKVPVEKVQAVIDGCSQAQAKNVSVVAPPPAPQPAEPAANLPAPALIMHPSETTPSPAVPAGSPSPTNTPASTIP